MRKRVGHYQIDRQLDSAAAGSTVYLAFDRESGRNVALEMMPVAGFDEVEIEQARQAIQIKAQLATRLRHARIAQAFEVVDDEGLWVAREPVKGETLENLLCTDTNVSKELVSRALYHTAECLDYAHKLGVQHGALSPAELLVQEDDSLKVLGFWKPSLASSGEVSPFERTHYSAPEQIRGVGAQAASDQYSLAVIAHELLTGVTPFQGDAIAVRNRIVLDSPPDPATVNPSLGAEAGAVLLRGLDKSPAARYGSCLEFVHALNDALEMTPGWALPEEYHGHTISLGDGSSPRQMEGELTEALLREVLMEKPAPPKARREYGKYLRPAAVGALAIVLILSLWAWFSSPPAQAPVAGLAVAAASPPPVVVDQPYSFSLQAQGGEAPYEWSVVGGQLPAGLTLDPQGVIRGQSGQAGVYDVSVQVKESGSASAVTQQISLTVKQGPRIKASDTLVDAVMGREYSHPLGVEGGQRPYRWVVTSGSVPPGMNLNSFSGFLGGRPQAEGTYRFAVSVSDLFGATSTREFELTVRPAPTGSIERIERAAAGRTAGAR
jgi:hypothetical protein